MPATDYLQTVQKALPSDHEAIIHVWEASVRATHYFLKEEDILYLRPLIQNNYLKAVDLYCTKDSTGSIVGFLGVIGKKIEMLFIDPLYRGKGIGKALVNFAITTLRCYKVDVNEQNEQALGFYLNLDFSIIGRSELDGIGKPYPILVMELKKV